MEGIVSKKAKKNQKALLARIQDFCTNVSNIRYGATTLDKKNLQYLVDEFEEIIHQMTKAQIHHNPEHDKDHGITPLSSQDDPVISSKYPTTDPQPIQKYDSQQIPKKDTAEIIKATLPQIEKIGSRFQKKNKPTATKKNTKKRSGKDISKNISKKGIKTPKIKNIPMNKSVKKEHTTLPKKISVKSKNTKPLLKKKTKKTPEKNKVNNQEKKKEHKKKWSL